MVALFAATVSVSAWLPWLTTGINGGGWANAIGGSIGSLHLPHGFGPGQLIVLLSSALLVAGAMVGRDLSVKPASVAALLISLIVVALTVRYYARQRQAAGIGCLRLVRRWGRRGRCDAVLDVGVGGVATRRPLVDADLCALQRLGALVAGQLPDERLAAAEMGEHHRRAFRRVKPMLAALQRGDDDREERPPFLGELIVTRAGPVGATCTAHRWRRTSAIGRPAATAARRAGSENR